MHNCYHSTLTSSQGLRKADGTPYLSSPLEIKAPTFLPPNSVLHLPKLFIASVRSADINIAGYPYDVLLASIQAPYQTCPDRVDSGAISFGDIFEDEPMTAFHKAQGRLLKKMTG